MKIMKVVKKVVLPAGGLILGTILASKGGEALTSAFGKGPVLENGDIIRIKNPETGEIQTCTIDHVNADKEGNEGD